jgi:hypothetical protein
LGILQALAVQGLEYGKDIRLAFAEIVLGFPVCGSTTSIPYLVHG